MLKLGAGEEIKPVRLSGGATIEVQPATAVKIGIASEAAGKHLMHAVA